MQAIHNDVSLVEEQRKTVSKLQKQLDDAKTMIKQLEDELDEKDRTYQMEQLRNSWLIFYVCNDGDGGGDDAEHCTANQVNAVSNC